MKMFLRMGLAQSKTVLFLCLFPFLGLINKSRAQDFDLVVYGGTSGGVTAALAGARMGKKVALVSPTKHLGGLTTSGLGWTDMGRNLGSKPLLGGLSKEFYHRVYLYYAAQPNWSSVKGMAGQHMAAFNHTEQIGLIFEPKVAEQIYTEMLAETKVQIFTGLLDLAQGVSMDGKKITSIRLEDGRVFSGKMFIDASYEGDVMAGAKVSFTVGREASATYGEAINGVQSGTSAGIAGLDPYKIKGDATSGLLRGIRESVPPNGTSDGALQAFCFRLCLTNKAANRVMVAKPANYKEEDFELVIRAVEGGQTAFLKNDMMPNGKTDTNNGGNVSLDYIGMNWGPGWDWSTLNHQQRAALAAEHQYWHLGLIWTIQNHPRVLAKVGASGLYPGWGLAADEFTDTGNFPPQLYVREARRMVSDYVMTTKNCAGTATAPDSVGMGAYTMDSHSAQRFNNNGLVKNEGGIGENVPARYTISYRSLIPKVGECENLLVPWCLSASHIAFGSIRMEPVFMTLGESAATAAALAINDKSSVQQLPYAKLAAVLRANGVLLTPENSVAASGLVVDTEDAMGVVVTGAWSTSTGSAGYNGNNYMHDANDGRGQKSVRFTPVLPAAGDYRVSLRWTAHANRATNVPIAITHSKGVTNATVNQQANGGTWYDLGVFTFAAGANGHLLLTNTGADGYVVADAAMWTPVGGKPTVQVYPAIPEAVRGNASPAALVFSRDGNTTAPLKVVYQLTGTANPSGLTPPPTGSITIPADQREAKLEMWALPATVPQGEKTAIFQIAPDASYTLAENTSVAIILRDPPFDSWRYNRFGAAQLADETISGALADPDGRGTVNLLRFFSGSEGPPRTSLFTQSGVLYFQFERHQAAADLGYSIEQSEDLQRWTPAPLSFSSASILRLGDYQQIHFPVGSASAMDGGKKFFRLSVRL